MTLDSVCVCVKLTRYKSGDEDSEQTQATVKNRRYLEQRQQVMALHAVVHPHSLRLTQLQIQGLLLTYVGEATNDIFDILPDTGTTCEAAVASLTQHFKTGGNRNVAIFEFREIIQDNNETLTQYYRRLKKAVDCEIENEDEEIKIQIIRKTRDPRLRKKALRENMDLKALLAHGQSLEITDQQAQRLEKAITELNALKHKRTQVAETTTGCI